MEFQTIEQCQQAELHRTKVRRSDGEIRGVSASLGFVLSIGWGFRKLKATGCKVGPDALHGNI